MVPSLLQVIAWPHFTKIRALKQGGILANVLLFACLGATANAHAAEQGFVLLLPTGLYSIAGTATVVLTLVLVTLLPKSRLSGLFRPRKIAQLPPMRALQTVTSLLSLGVFLALIYVGVAGPRDPLSNLLPLVLWTFWWIALVVIQALFGNLWHWINPWIGLYRISMGQTAPMFRLPPALRLWPAVALLVLFNIFALADPAPNDPTRLATITLTYWGFTFVGMVLFGAKPWLTRVEVFSVFLTKAALLSPIQWAPALRIGMPGWAALAPAKDGVSGAVFIIVLLGSGSFDGLHETFWWLDKIGINPLEFPGRSAVITQTIVGLLVGNAILIALFTACVWVGVSLSNRWSTNHDVSLGLALAGFGVTLLPIIVGFHFAHFLTAFLVNVQYLLAAIGDPMATGANVLGLGRLQVTTGFLNTPGPVRTLWLTQAGAVVYAHVLAVIMAHALAHRLFPSQRAALLSQIGIAALMVLYTVFGLWLLASPRGV